MLEVFDGLSDRSRRLRFLGAKPRLPERDLDVLVDVGGCGRERSERPWKTSSTVSRSP